MMGMGGGTMQPFLQLNLHEDREKAEAASPPKPVSEEQPSAEEDERMKRIAAKAAHKAATEYRHGGSGLFSK